MTQLKQRQIFLLLITLVCLCQLNYCNGQNKRLKNYPSLDNVGSERAISSQIVSKIDSLEKEISQIKEILLFTIERPDSGRSSFEKIQRVGEADDGESPQVTHNNKRKAGGQQLPYFGSRGRRGHIQIPYMGSRG